ncbi:MAG: SUMF1/EgtB/PvdO family nonheme iron enzyme [Anaerolineae bacterium]|nr:SUMF1/EgtB/PvdO family nonheme iron enzyme [Anaerolineae bacterium]
MHLRGGSWNNNQDNARAAYRNNNNPDNRNNNIGFRVVVSSHSSVPLQRRSLTDERIANCPLLSEAAVSRIAGRVRFASRGEEIEKAQGYPVRTGETHRRAYTKNGDGSAGSRFCVCAVR